MQTALTLGLVAVNASQPVIREDSGANDWLSAPSVLEQHSLFNISGTSTEHRILPMDFSPVLGVSLEKHDEMRPERIVFI